MLNKFFIIFLSAFIFTHAVSAGVILRKNEKKLYVGANSTEALMEYSGMVQIQSTKLPSLTKMKKAIESQVEHTIGPMSLADYTAVPKGDHVISGIKVLAHEKNIYSIGYDFKGTIVIENGPKSVYEIILATDPTKIYAASFVGNISPCTDEHYQSEGDFWYFWNPYNEGCQLKKSQDFTVVKTKITRFTNTKLSYPEYHNLPDADGNITIHILFGMDDNSKGRNPLRSADINADNYRILRKYLLDKGYKATKWTQEEIYGIVKTINGDDPYVETIQKGNIIYRFFFGPSAINEDSVAFHWFYKDAIENASVMIYSGHSGLGGHLDLDSIEESLGERIHFNTKKYQIFFFDSCTSYKYYNQAYFDRKMTSNDPNGTKKLDVFTNGLSTYFHVMPDSSTAIAVAFEKALGYAKSGNGFVSYQTLAKQIDSDNLFGVNGDADNEAPRTIK